jgi:2-dehydro-3-deoxyglucarate aldolase
MNNKVKQKLISGKVSVGSWLTLAHTAIAEIMAESGFDWLAIDMEHSVIGIQDIEPLVQAISASGCVPLVRLSSNDPVLVKRVMDAGSYGVIVPMVNSREEAEKAVRSVKYPPDGDRSVGLYRAQGWGVKFEEYKNTVNRESLVIVQIEHRRAIENIADIISVPGLDGVMIGPYDISGSLGVIGELDHPLVKQAQAKVLSAAKAAKKVAGIHVVSASPSAVKDRVKEGFTFIAYSTDAIMLDGKCREATAELKSFLDKGR